MLLFTYSIPYSEECIGQDKYSELPLQYQALVPGFLERGNYGEFQLVWTREPLKALDGWCVLLLLGAKATIQRTSAVHIPLPHSHFHLLALHVLGMRNRSDYIHSLCFHGFSSSIRLPCCSSASDELVVWLYPAPIDPKLLLLVDLPFCFPHRYHTDHGQRIADPIKASRNHSTQIILHLAACLSPPA